MLIVTNSSLFANTSTSLIRTHSFMVRSILLLSTNERVVTESVKSNGISSNHCNLYHNPIPRFDVPTYSVHVDAGAHTSFYSAVLASIISSSAQREHHTPKVTASTIDKRSWFFLLMPQFFSSFYSTTHFWAPKGCDKQLLRDSMKTLDFTSHYSFNQGDCSV